MSQQKIDRRKEDKKNRDKLRARDRRNAALSRLAVILLAILAVGWIGYSIYNTATRKTDEELAAGETIELSLDDYTEYLGSLDAEE